MKAKLISKCGLLAAFALCWFVTGSALAQCPCPPAPTDDAQHATLVAPYLWNGPVTYTTIVNGCAVTVCYCWRTTSSNNHDYCITQICYDPNCPGLHFLSPGAILGLAFQNLMHDNPQRFPCPECPSKDIEWTESLASCWKTTITVNPDGSTTYQHTMCPEHGWCLDAYFVCCGPDIDPNTGEGVKHFTYDRSVQTTYQCDAPNGCAEFPCPPHIE